MRSKHFQNSAFQEDAGFQNKGLCNSSLKLTAEKQYIITDGMR